METISVIIRFLFPKKNKDSCFCPECSKEITATEWVHETDSGGGLITTTFICAKCARTKGLELNAIYGHSGKAVRSYCWNEEEVRKLQELAGQPVKQKN